ncbi:hypothetical protein JXB41_08015 [Candidatus Woesearchaeota archaeon]|nr:hypothetical protein [Candidatus Woesearchaeota archaeon]
MKKIIIALLLLILIAACKKQEPIGGERDEYGCLGPAGYSWNEDVGACIRGWELDDNQREAVKTAVSFLSYRVTVLEVEVLKCPGCFIVHLQRNDNQNQFTINLADWKISDGTDQEDKIELYACIDDSACIPLPSECHPMTCINKEFESNYKKPEICTMEYRYDAAYNPEDCICYEGRCSNVNQMKKITNEHALQIAQDSECAEKGELLGNYVYNPYTSTWWFDMKMKPEFEKEICSPACVVDEKTETAEINWRCTGALPDE